MIIRKRRPKTERQIWIEHYRQRSGASKKKATAAAKLVFDRAKAVKRQQEREGQQ